VELGAAVNQATVGSLGREVGVGSGHDCGLHDLLLLYDACVRGCTVVYALFWQAWDVGRPGRCVRTWGCVGGCVCGVRGDAWEDEEGDDERW
jgi:hypothetical protein